MNNDDYHDDIERLEVQIDELTTRIESCSKFILVGKIAVVGGSIGLIAALVGAIEFSPVILAVATVAVLGGIVTAGSNYSTAKEAVHELRVAEARWTALIEQIDLRLVPNPNH